jgi:hypothetical protein
LAIATDRTAESHPFRRPGVGVQVYFELVCRRVRSRKISPDTHIAAAKGHRACRTYWLESTKSRVELGDNSAYVVELRFQSVEFDIESSFTARLHDILVIDPVDVIVIALVSYTCHCLISFWSVVEAFGFGTYVSLRACYSRKFGKLYAGNALVGSCSTSGTC